jgi:hypothetical protein
MYNDMYIARQILGYTPFYIFKNPCFISNDNK